MQGAFGLVFHRKWSARWNAVWQPFFAADLVGYTRLMAADEQGTLVRLRQVLAEIFHPTIARYSGRIVKTLGDGVLAEFGSVIAATTCAVKLQEQLADLAARDRHTAKLLFRMGINLGDIIIDGHDVFGDGVNIASRVEALAPPGGICVTRPVRDQIRDRLDYHLQDYGEISVKNAARAVRVFSVVTDTGLADDLIAKAVRRRRRLVRRVAVPTLVVATLVLDGAMVSQVQAPVVAMGPERAVSAAQPLVYALKRANLRAGPGTGYAVIGKANPGQSFVLQGRTQAKTGAPWLHIQRPNGQGEAYVYAKLMTSSKPQPAPVPARVPDPAPREPTIALGWGPAFGQATPLGDGGGDTAQIELSLQPVALAAACPTKRLRCPGF